MKRRLIIKKILLNIYGTNNDFILEIIFFLIEKIPSSVLKKNKKPEKQKNNGTANLPIELPINS
jgi:hypothetical protein